MPTIEKAMKLHKLPNGSWIDLSTVKAITPLPSESSEYGGTHRARVRVDHGAHGMEIVTANDDYHAQQMADELASAVNTLERENAALREFQEQVMPFLTRLIEPRFDAFETDEYVNGSTDAIRAINAAKKLLQ